MNNIPEIHFKAEHDEDGQLVGTLTIDFGDSKNIYHGPLKKDGVALGVEHDIDWLPASDYQLNTGVAAARRSGSHFTIKLDFLRAEKPAEAS